MSLEPVKNPPCFRVHVVSKRAGHDKRVEIFTVLLTDLHSVAEDRLDARALHSASLIPDNGSADLIPDLFFEEWDFIDSPRLCAR